VLRNCICRLATLNRIGYLAREQEVASDPPDTEKKKINRSWITLLLSK